MLVSTLAAGECTGDAGLASDVGAADDASLTSLSFNWLLILSNLDAPDFAACPPMSEREESGRVVESLLTTGSMVISINAYRGVQLLSEKVSFLAIPKSQHQEIR
jgi:hypothetical protein